MNNVPLIFGSRPQDPAYSRLGADPGGQLGVQLPELQVGAIFISKASGSAAEKHMGERLFLILKDSKGLVIVGHPAEACPRTSFRVKREKGTHSQAQGK